MYSLVSSSLGPTHVTDTSLIFLATRQAHLQNAVYLNAIISSPRSHFILCYLPRHVPGKAGSNARRHLFGLYRYPLAI